MLDSIAYDWITASGSHGRADTTCYIAATKDMNEGGIETSEAIAAECIEHWGLNVAIDDETPAHMAREGYDATDLAKAFARFMATRPDVPTSARVMEIAAGCLSNGVDINALAQEWTNSPEAEVDEDGTIWTGQTFIDDDEGLTKFCDFVEAKQ
jgi:hypothetical protein